MVRITDDTGTGIGARVTKEHRLEVDSVSASELHFHSLEYGKAYIYITDGFVNITTINTETGVFYIKNDSTTDNLIINSIIVSGDQIQTIKIYKNVTGGTLLSAALAGSSTNMSFTSSKASETTVYKGVNGSTVSGGTLLTQFIESVGTSRIPFEDALILGPLDSITVTFALAVAGNVSVELIGYEE